MAILKTAAINVPRIGYNPVDDTLRGLLIEEARTNVLLQNRNLGVSPWGGNATRVQNAVGLKGVANTAWTVTDNDAGAVQTVAQNITVPNDSNRYVVSMYIKKTAATQYGGFRLELSGGTTAVGGPLGDVFIRPSDGALSIQKSQIALHEAHDAGDWWRLIAAIDNNGTGNTTLQVQILPAASTDGSGNQNTAATGSLIVDYPQVELNARFASSPIETGATAVTRAADNVTSPITTPLPDEFAFVFEGTTAPGLSPTDAQILIDVNDRTNNNRINFNRALNGTVRFTSRVGNVITMNNVGTGESFPDLSPLKVAASVSTTGVRMCVNGGSVLTFSGGVAIAAFTTRYIGQAFSGVAVWNGWIKNLTEIPRALSDAELVQESTL